MLLELLAKRKRKLPNIPKKYEICQYTQTYCPSKNFLGKVEEKRMSTKMIKKKKRKRV